MDVFENSYSESGPCNSAAQHSRMHTEGSRFTQDSPKYSVPTRGHTRLDTIEEQLVSFSKTLSATSEEAHQRMNRDADAIHQRIGSLENHIMKIVDHLGLSL